MTLFPLARSVTNRRADGGLPILLPQESPSSHKIFRMMADVCEAFCLFSVFSGLITNIRVHSCPFVVPQKQLSAVGEIVKIPLDENNGRSFVSRTARQVAQTAQQVRQLAGRRPQRFILSDQVLLL